MNSLQYVRRGKNTFMYLLVVDLVPVLILFAGLYALASSKDTILSSIISFIHPSRDTLDITFSALIAIGFVIAFFLGLIMVFVAWLQYISLEYALGDSAFKVHRGILNLTETSIPYRQIQNVDISRPLVYRIFGMNRITILTAAEDNPNTPDINETGSDLDLVDNSTVRFIQHELLRRSAIQAARTLHPVHPTDAHTH